MQEIVLIPKRYLTKNLEVMCHDVCNLFSYEFLKNTYVREIKKEKCEHLVTLKRKQCSLYCFSVHFSRFVHFLIKRLWKESSDRNKKGERKL